MSDANVRVNVRVERATSSSPAGHIDPKGEAGAAGAGVRRPFWTLRQAAQRDGVLQLYIYGDVEGDWYDWWNNREVVSETSANHFREELSRYPDAKEIEIYINSYGGEVFEGTAIYNQLRRHPAHKTVYVDGFACSIASVIAMAGDEVIMPRNTMMMIHNMWMGAVGNAQQLRKAADDLDVINAAGRQAYLLKADDKLDEATLTAMMDAETWLTAADCIRLGLADRYADEDADLSGAAAILQRVNAGLEQQVERNRAIAARLREIGSRENPPAAETSSGGCAATFPVRGEGMRTAEGVGPCGESGLGAEEKDGKQPSEPGGDGNAVPEREDGEKDAPEKPGLMAFLAGVEI